MGGSVGTFFVEKSKTIPRNFDDNQLQMVLKEAKVLLHGRDNRTPVVGPLPLIERYCRGAYEYYEELRPDDKGKSDLSDSLAFTDVLFCYAQEVLKEYQSRESEEELDSLSDSEHLKRMFFNEIENDPLFEKRMEVLKNWSETLDKSNPNSFTPLNFSDDLLKLVIEEALYILGETDQKVNSMILDILTKLAYMNFADKNVLEPAFEQSGIKRDVSTVTYIFQFARSVVREFSRRFENGKNYEENTLEKIFYSPVDVSSILDKV